jgi:hypothetical protein
LPSLFYHVPLNKRGSMFFQHDGTPLHSSHEVRNSLNYRFHGRWIGRGGPTIGQPGVQSGLLCTVMDENTGLQCEGSNVRLTAESHFGCRRPSQIRPAKLRRETSAVHNRAAACVAADGGIFGNQL